MPLKIYKPTSAGRRLSSGDSFNDVTKTKPEKRLTVILKKKGGRNNQGIITVRHHGGGAKQRYRLVDFKQDRLNEPAKVIAIEYDPNRSARLALLQFSDGAKIYILAVHQMKVGDAVISSDKTVAMTVGNRMPLGNIAMGMLVHNIELVPGQGGELMRSAGSAAMIMSKDEGFVHLKMSSGEIRKFSEACRASIGQVSNLDWRNIRWGKAGRLRHRGWRPTVRGKAMNPVDHPHGGGEGNQPIGMVHPKTAQGKAALGVPTRDKNKFSNKFIISRRNKRKK